jgi:hypothetical protein
MLIIIQTQKITFFKTCAIPFAAEEMDIEDPAGTICSSLPIMTA